MRSANPSNRPPLGLRKRIAASARRSSRLSPTNDGRYQATTRIPAACAASTKRPRARGRTRSTRCL